MIEATEPVEDGGAPSTLDAGLYIVATPIGNLRDITLRALDTLRAADVIAAEDTRVTRKLLSAFGLNGRLVAYHAHNEAAQESVILDALGAGQRVALVSDAGTPLVSDPGARLVSAAIAAGHRVIPIPGACAAIAGLSVAGIRVCRICATKSGRAARVFRAMGRQCSHADCLRNRAAFGGESRRYGRRFWPTRGRDRARVNKAV
jgi:siroheme synthase